MNKASNWTPDPKDQANLESYLQMIHKRKKIVPWSPEHGFLKIGSPDPIDPGLYAGEVFPVVASAQHGEKNGRKVVTLVVNKGAVGKIGVYEPRDVDTFVPNGPAIKSDAEVAKDAGDAVASAIQSFHDERDPLDGDGLDTYPLPGDKRPIREQVNDHPHLTVLVTLEWSEIGVEAVVTERIYEWFDTEAAAVEYAKELDAFAEDHATVEGDGMYVVARLKTGETLTTKRVTVHGVVKKEIADEIAKIIRDKPDGEIIFDPPMPKPKRKPRKAKPKVSAAPTPTPVQPVPDVIKPPEPKRKVVRKVAAKKKKAAPDVEITAKAKSMRMKRMAKRNGNAWEAEAAPAVKSKPRPKRKAASKETVDA